MAFISKCLLLQIFLQRTYFHRSPSVYARYILYGLQREVEFLSGSVSVFSNLLGIIILFSKKSNVQVFLHFTNTILPNYWFYQTGKERVVSIAPHLVLSIFWYVHSSFFGLVFGTLFFFFLPIFPKAQLLFLINLEDNIFFS